MKRDDLPIQEPCTANWSEMSGTEQKRFCGKCSKHVHDLSAMTEPEAKQVIQTVKNPCVRYRCRPDGTIRFKPSRRVTLVRSSMIAGGLMIGMSAAGSVTPQEPDVPSNETSFFERISEALWSMLTDSEESTEIQGGLGDVESFAPEVTEPPAESLEPEVHEIHLGGLMPMPEIHPTNVEHDQPATEDE